MAGEPPLQDEEGEVEPALVAARLDDPQGVGDRRAVAPETMGDGRHGNSDRDMGEVGGEMPGEGRTGPPPARRENRVHRTIHEGRGEGKRDA
jgi:hypothetical protein